MSANFNLGDSSKNVPGFSRVTINSTFDKENSSLPWFEIALDPFNVNFLFNGTQIENFSETKLYQKLIVKKFLIPLSPIHRERPSRLLSVDERILGFCFFYTPDLR